MIITNNTDFWSCQLNGKDNPVAFASREQAIEARARRLAHVAKEFRRYELTGETELKMSTTYRPCSNNTLRSVTIPHESNYPDIVRHHAPKTAIAEEWGKDPIITWVATDLPCAAPRLTTEEIALQRANMGLMAENKRLRKLNAELKEKLGLTMVQSFPV